MYHAPPWTRQLSNLPALSRHFSRIQGSTLRQTRKEKGGRAKRGEKGMEGKGREEK